MMMMMMMMTVIFTVKKTADEPRDKMVSRAGRIHDLDYRARISLTGQMQDYNP